jgi:hypothetical protein
VSFSRKDATALLRTDAAVGLVLVQPIHDGEVFHHRMVDVAFADELAKFLASERGSMSLIPADCREGARLREDVLEAECQHDPGIHATRRRAPVDDVHEARRRQPAGRGRCRRTKEADKFGYLTCSLPPTPQLTMPRHA